MTEELPLYTHWERVLLDRTMKFPRLVRFTLANRMDNLGPGHADVAPGLDPPDAGRGHRRGGQRARTG